MTANFLKQILALLEPIGFVWICLLALAVRAWVVRQRGLAAALLALSTLLFVTGSTRLPGDLLGSLERPYAGVKLEALPPADAIVMLGGGTEPSLYEAGGFHLTPAGDRVNMALEMLRLQKASALALGGGGSTFDGKFVSESVVVGQWFEEWRKRGAVDASVEINPLPPCEDTHDEAVATAALAAKKGWHHILLVTSANHMRRASALFRTQQLEVTPVPCNFLTTVSTASGNQGFGVPSWNGSAKVAAWLHEESGWLMYRKRGWISKEAAQAGP